MARTSTKMKMSMVEGENGYTAKMEFANGETREFAFGMDHDLFARFAVHGVEQKLRDRIAASETVEDAVNAIDGLIEALNAGDWTVRGGTGEPKETGGLLTRALAQITGKALDEVQTVVNALDKKQQAALRADPDIAKVIESLRPAKKAPKDVDLAGLKASLGL